MSSPGKLKLTNTLPLLNPPICLEVLYSHIRNGTSPNEYIANFKSKRRKLCNVPSEITKSNSLSSNGYGSCAL
jgi:hypothetical protein